jgi:DNA-binding NtrC family response regulator
MDTAPAQHRHVMLVDDDESLLRLVTAWLKTAGYEVEAFDHFETAKTRLKDFTPDVLITDVRLGDFNGLQLVMFAKLEHPEITAVVLTGFEDPVLRRDASAAGATYLVKPVRTEQLLEAIRVTNPAGLT